MGTGRCAPGTVSGSFPSVRQGSDHGDAHEKPRGKQEPCHDCRVHSVLPPKGFGGPGERMAPLPIRRPRGRRARQSPCQRRRGARRTRCRKRNSLPLPGKALQRSSAACARPGRASARDSRRVDAKRSGAGEKAIQIVRGRIRPRRAPLETSWAPAAARGIDADRGLPSVSACPLAANGRESRRLRQPVATKPLVGGLRRGFHAANADIQSDRHGLR